MAEDRPYADRPRQVTVSAWVVGVSSAVMLLGVATQMSRFRTLDFRETVSTRLRESGLTVGLDDALLTVRIVLMVVGAVSAAAVVFAFFAARRDRSARIALSVLALPMLVGGMFVDPFLAGFVVAATVLLWTGASADWYAGRAPRPVPAATSPEPPNPPGPPSPAAPPVPSAPSRSRVDLDALPPPDAPWQPAYHRPALVAAAAARPGRLVVATVLAMVLGAVVAAAMLAVAVVVGTDAGHEAISRALADNPGSNPAGYSVSEIASGVLVVAVALALWAAAAVVVAALALAGHGWARGALLVSSGLAGALSLLTVLAWPGFIVLTGACVLTCVLLLHPTVSAWYAGRRGPAVPRLDHRAD